MTQTSSDLPVGTLKRADAPELADHTLVLDSQEIEASMAHVPAGAADALGTVSGLLERVIDADTLEVWATDSARPFDVGARYQRIA